MARIIVRNTAISGSKPTSLVQGELALNVTDGKLYYGSSSANIVKEFTGSASGGGGSSVSASYATTASYAATASYALNGGVTQLLAGPNVTLSPASGLGQVTVSAASSGGGGFNTATGSYGSFYDTTTQTNPVANIPRSMSLNETDITNGVSVSGSTNPFNTYIKTENAGVYDIQFSAQVEKTDSGTDEIVIWLRKNGTDLTDTATTITLSGNNAKQVAAWNWFVTSAANDYYQIIWVSADTGMRLLAETISGTHPGIPSVIVTANRVDQFLSNTGSFSGSFTGQFTGSLFGTSSWATNASTASFITGSTNAFIQGGNSFGATALLGTNDNQSLALETSGSTRMFISSSGNIGIGTTSSLARVTINHDASLINPLELVNTYSGTGFFSNIVWKNSTNLVRGNFGVNNQSGEFRWDVSSGGYFPTIYSNGAEIIRINTSGNTGIKTTTPAATLDVSGSVNISGSGNQVPLRVYSGSTPLLYVSQSGQVGIGTSTPAYNLEVVGSNTATARFYGGSGTAAVGIGVNGTLQSSGGQFRVYANTSVPLSLGSYNTYGDLWIINGNTGIGYGTSLPTLTSRFSIRGSGATSATTTFLVQNSTPSTLFSILDNGNVGVGTAAPSASLYISGASSAALFEIDSPAVNNILFVSGSGRVGVGTSNPSTTLDVSGSTIIANLLVVGSSSLGPSENTITLGARDTASEGGQVGFNAPGGTYTSASFIDLYQDRLRILRGTNAGSDAEVAWWSMHNKQMALPAYNSATAFPGTGSAVLTTDTSGNVITQVFKDVAEQTYTGTIAWTGTAAPSGSTTHTYRWSQVGKTVNLNITLVYTGPGNAVSTVTTALPADCPTPYVPSGQSGAGALISVVSAHLTTTTTIGANIARGGLRINSTNNGYELSATATAAGYKTLVTSVQYFAV